MFWVRTVGEVCVHTLLIVSLSVDTVIGRGVSTVGLPGAYVCPVEDPDGDDQDDADQDHSHHHATAQHQQCPKLILYKRNWSDSLIQQ